MSGEIFKARTSLATCSEGDAKPTFCRTEPVCSSENYTLDKVQFLVEFGFVALKWRDNVLQSADDGDRKSQDEGMFICKSADGL